METTDTTESGERVNITNYKHHSSDTQDIDSKYSLSNIQQMSKSDIQASIQKVDLDALSHDAIANFQEEVKVSKIEKADIKDSLVKYLVNTECWDYQKSSNFINFVDSMIDSTPYKPPQYERVLKFPSQESERLLRHYLSLAQHSIKVCMYTFTNRQLMDCLKDAQNQGIKVNLITDKESLSTLYIHEMAAIGIECTHHNLTNSAKMHHKFAIVDDLILINGSLNWTAKGVRQNHENVIISGSKVYIKEFKDEFKMLWRTYGHNILCQADSANKVRKEVEYLDNKRMLKEKEKRSNKYVKEAKKLVDAYNNAKRQ
jgi:cardiolipin hydrolase